jgi:hypothetical protein
VPDGAPEATCNDDLTCAEGGEVRVEYVTFTDPPGPGGRTTGTRVTSYLMSDADTGMDPDSFPMIAFGECHDVGGLTTWPTAQGEAPTYIDFGQTIIQSGDKPAFTVPVGGAPPALDPVGRSHIGHWGFMFGIDDADTNLEGNAPVDIIFTGSDEWPAMALAEATFIPKPFTLLDPAPGSGPIQLVMGSDKTLTYTVEESDTDHPIGWLVAFLVGGKVRVVCPELQDGSATVTAADITALATYGTSGVSARQTFVHHVMDMKVGEEHRRLDAIGVWCNVTPFTIVTAP